MILLIDNYDSFTFNLYQYLRKLGAEIIVIRNDKVSIEEVRQLAPEAIVLSPGPGRPENAGICVELVTTFAPTIPIMGICLGHQAIGLAFGAVICKAKTIMHGKESKLEHSGTSIMKFLPDQVEVMRYHSLVIDRDTLSPEFTILAESLDDHEIMAIKHNVFPLYGLQFHPESIGTRDGLKMLENFLAEIRKEEIIYETLS